MKLQHLLYCDVSLNAVPTYSGTSLKVLGQRGLGKMTSGTCGGNAGSKSQNIPNVNVLWQIFLLHRSCVALGYVISVLARAQFSPGNPKKVVMGQGHSLLFLPFQQVKGF